jgi:hypothetical protein
MRKIVFSLITVTIFILGCKTSGSFYQSEPTFVTSEPNGEAIIKFIPKGLYGEAREKNAKYRVVYEALFNGISGLDNKRPIVTTVNAEKKFESYFNGFFAENGPFLNFVKIKSNNRLNVSEKKPNPVVLVLKRTELISEMRKANIIQ